MTALKWGTKFSEKIFGRNRKGGKLERDLLGPFVITNIEGKSADLKSTKGSTLAKIYIDH